MPTVVFVSGFDPTEIGHGGNHRTYQILHDLESIVGKEQVTFVAYRQWRQAHPLSPAADIARRVQRRLAYYAENPLKYFAFNSYSPRGHSDHDFVIYYEDLIRHSKLPILSIIEHTTFGALAAINANHNIPTIICPQNLESLDAGAPYSAFKRRLTAQVTTTDLINEINFLAQCAERLFISKVEAGLIGGLGLPSRYYPYLPVGAIRERLARIRQERAKGLVERDLFLMLGSTGHLTTRDSFAWFVANAKEHPLPQVRIVVGGGRTDGLLPSETTVEGLELRGWLEQSELDELLMRAQAVLVPQLSGFGSPTRIAEMACAGVPVLVSRQATFSLDTPPGVEIVEDSWDAWSGKIVEASGRSRPAASTYEEYLAWERAQPRTLETIKSHLPVQRSEH